MQFLARRRRQTPAIIIVSLIDILIVLLIFVMVTTTFKQQPALKLALPESKQPREGASEAQLVVTVAKEQPYLYLGSMPVTLDDLTRELQNRVGKDAHLTLAIRADTAAPFGQIVKVMDAAKAAKIKTVSAFTKSPGLP